jgi:uncharacterized protein
MPRPKRMRKVTTPPPLRGFKPFGAEKEEKPVVINFEEYEAIRLCDFELLGQLEAAQLMQVSRPTFTRIYESARRKVALAFTKACPIVFEGGKVYFDSDWFSCSDCGCVFNNPFPESKIEHCALCGSKSVVPYKSINSGDTNKNALLTEKL